MTSRSHPARRVRAIWIVGIFSLHVLLVAAPSLQRAFAEFKEMGGDLPWPTRALLGFAHWWRHSSGWLMLSPALLLVLLAVFRATRRPGEAAGGMLLVFSVLFWGALLTGFVLAIFLPLVRLMEALAR